jgi:LysM domain
MSSAYGGINPAQPYWSPTSLQNQGPTAQQVLQPVANLLGTTSQSLISQMQSGATLSGIATQQGVSQNDLITAIEQGLQSTNPQTSAISQNGTPSSIATLAANIANGTAKVGGHHHHHHGGGSTSTTSTTDTDDDSDTSSSGIGSSTIDSLSSILGVAPETLLQALSQGTSVSQLASSSGIPSSSLQSLLSTGLQIDTTA